MSIKSGMRRVPWGRWRLSIKSGMCRVPWGSSPRLCRAKPAGAGWRAPSGEWKLRIYSGMRSCRRAEAPGSPRRSPPARAMADYFFKDHRVAQIQSYTTSRRPTMEHSFCYQAARRMAKLMAPLRGLTVPCSFSVIEGRWNEYFPHGPDEKEYTPSASARGAGMEGGVRRSGATGYL